MNFDIAGRQIGGNFPPLIIAEIGINHGGSIDVAIEMVDAAADCGVEVVKHQTHIIDDEMSLAAKTVVPGNESRSIYDIMATCALNEHDEYLMMQHTLKRGLIFLSTPFSRAAVLRLQKFDLPAYKIGSGEMNNIPLLKLIASFGKPVIMSTGMHDLASVQKSVHVLETAGVPFALLHTTNLYPTPDKLVRLGAVQELQKAFPNIPIGLSDHTTDNLACLGAVALGASILERHFTDSMHRQGPDIVCSMDPEACRDLIHQSKRMAVLRKGSKSKIPEEQVTRNFAFASVVAISDIHPGDSFTEENVWVKRPGTGEIPAAEMESIIGKKAIRSVNTGDQLRWEDIGE